MKHGRINAALLASALTLAVAGCDRKRAASPSDSTNASAGGLENWKQQAENAVTTTGAYLLRQKDQLQKSLAEKMTNFDRQLSDLKAKSDQAGGRARFQWTNTLTQLQQKKRVAADKLEQLKQLKNSSADKWQDFKAGAEAAFADLEKAFQDAFTRFQSGDKPDKP